MERLDRSREQTAAVVDARSRELTAAALIGFVQLYSAQRCLRDTHSGK